MKKISCVLLLMFLLLQPIEACSAPIQTEGTTSFSILAQEDSGITVSHEKLTYDISNGLSQCRFFSSYTLVSDKDQTLKMALPYIIGDNPKIEIKMNQEVIPYINVITNFSAEDVKKSEQIEFSLLKEALYQAQQDASLEPLYMTSLSLEEEEYIIEYHIEDSEKILVAHGSNMEVSLRKMIFSE